LSAFALTREFWGSEKILPAKLAFAIAVDVQTDPGVEKLSATSHSVGRSEEVDFRRMNNGLGSYDCIANTGRWRLGAGLPGHWHEGEDANH